MTEAFFIYFSLLFIMVVLAFMKKFSFPTESLNENRAFNRISVISITLFTVVLGLRYYVGGDYGGYLSYYKYLNLKSSVTETYLEAGFVYLMFILKFLTLPSTFLFIATTFLQIFFVYKWVGHFKYLLPWIIIFYFLTLYLFESMSLIRQAMAFSLLLYSMVFIYKSKKIHFALLVIAASLFHRSAIFFLPFYFFIQYDWIRYKYIQLALLVLIFIFNADLIQPFFDVIKPVALFLNYEGYSEQRADLFFESRQTGFGIFFLFAVDCIIILFSDKLKTIFKDQKYIAYHNMFLVGALLTSISSNSYSIVMSRFNFYFVSFRIIVLSFLCYYIFALSKNKFFYVIGVVILLAYLGWFILAITRGAAWCSPFQFIFQDYRPLR